MCNCVPELKIPFEVDVEIGQNWGEISKWLEMAIIQTHKRQGILGCNHTQWLSYSLFSLCGIHDLWWEKQVF